MARPQIPPKRVPGREESLLRCPDPRAEGGCRVVRMSSQTLSPAKKKVKTGRRAAGGNAVERAQDDASSLSQMLMSFGGLCWWCLRGHHHPAECSCQGEPDMTKFKIVKGSKRGQTSTAPQCKCEGCTGKTAEPVGKLSRRAYEDHRKKYRKEHQKQMKVLENAAKKRARQHAMLLNEPLRGSGPLGQF